MVVGLLEALCTAGSADGGAATAYPMLQALASVSVVAINIDTLKKVGMTTKLEYCSDVGTEMLSVVSTETIECGQFQTMESGMKNTQRGNGEQLLTYREMALEFTKVVKRTLRYDPYEDKLSLTRDDMRSVSGRRHWSDSLREPINEQLGPLCGWHLVMMPGGYMLQRLSDYENATTYADLPEPVLKVLPAPQRAPVKQIRKIRCIGAA